MRRTSSSTSPTSRCSGPVERFALASRVLALRRAVRRRGLPPRSAGARAVRAPVDRRRRNGEARRQDRGHRTSRAASRGRPTGRRRRDGAGRAARARGRHRSADRRGARRALAFGPSRRIRPSRDRCPRRCRDRRLPAMRRRARGRRGVVERRRGSAHRRRARARSSSSSTGAARRCRRSPPTAPSSSSAGIRTRGRRRVPQRVPAPSRGPRRRDDGRAGVGLGSRQTAVEPRCATDVPVVRDDAAAHARSSTSAADRSPTSARRHPRAHALLREHLESVHGAEVVHVSGNLANRAALRDELERHRRRRLPRRAEGCRDRRRRGGCARRGAEVVLAANDVVPLPGEPDLDEMLLGMAKFRS